MGQVDRLNRSITPLLFRARQSVGMSQEAFGDSLGVSKRTVSRWEAGGATLSPFQACQLARMVYPKDTVLAAELAGAASETLESLGLMVKAPAPLGPPPVPALAPLPSRLVVDAVVCVAADALGAAPNTVRAALYAAFKRAKELRLSVDDVEIALAPAAPASPVEGRKAAKG
jgi:transcriptional regulator with XRE-family HTH domain